MAFVSLFPETCTLTGKPKKESCSGEIQTLCSLTLCNVTAEWTGQIPQPASGWNFSLEASQDLLWNDRAFLTKLIDPFVAQLNASPLQNSWSDLWTEDNMTVSGKQDEVHCGGEWRSSLLKKLFYRPFSFQKNRRDPERNFFPLFCSTQKCGMNLR